MIDILIKHSAMMVFSIFVYIKLLNIRIEKKIFLYYFIYLLFSIPCIYVLSKHITSFSLIIMNIFFTIFVVTKIKQSLNLSITTSIISFGITYLVYLLSAAVVSFAGVIIASLLNREYNGGIYATISTILLQLVIINIVFRFKRLKNGMPFLIEHGSGDVFVFVSICLLIAASFIGGNSNVDTIYAVPIFFVLLSGLVIFFWWRNSLTKKYIEKVKAQEIQALHDKIRQKDAETKTLEKHNDALSKIIHKDNKLIPSLEYAVRQYLLTAVSEDATERLEKGKRLLAQIESISSERRGIITSYEAISKRFPSTGVSSVDSLLIYMFHKSKEHQINFNVSVSGSVKYLIENIAAEHDINTLLADLIENAIIATKQCTSKNILVHIGISNNCYTICIYDSGIPFTPETVSDLGLKRTTTHQSEGGSGIGLMTTFEILQTYLASFVIEDILDNALYTKAVSVLFDNLGQFRTAYNNEEKTVLLSSLDDIIFANDIGHKNYIHKRLQKEIIPQP